MKRFGNLWVKVCDRKNVERATVDVIGTTLTKMTSRKNAYEKTNPGKVYKLRVCEEEAIYAREHFDEYVERIVKALENETYCFGEMLAAVVYEHKRRQIDYPAHLDDRVYHHCLMNVTGPLMIDKMTRDTYGSLKGRGLNQIAEKMKVALRTHPDWMYVQTDFHHCYASISHEKLKALLRRVFKDTKVLRMFDLIIDQFSPGLAIGVFPSGYLANLFISPLGHLLKEKYHVKYVFIYMDDIVCLVESKKEAHEVLEAINEFGNDVGLEVKKNARIAPVSSGIRTCGYTFYPTHTLLRKSIKERMKRNIKKWEGADDATFKLKLASHYGWCSHADCRHLIRVSFGDRYYVFQKNMEAQKYKKLSEIRAKDNWFGLPRESRMSIKELFNKEIIVFELMDVVIKGESKIAVRFAFVDSEDEMHYFITRSGVIAERLSMAKDDMPFIATIKEEKNYFKIE